MEYLLIYILSFLAYLPVQSLFINGVYISSKDSDTVLPDGTVKKGEMILFPLYRYLNQTYTKRILFTYSQIGKQTTKLPTDFGGVIQWEQTAFSGGFPIYSTLSNIDFKVIRDWAEAELNAKIFYNHLEKSLEIYKDVTFYKFSKYLRKPIISCVVCMASFWSIFTFLIPALLLFWNPLLIVIIWIGNVFCLSYLNYFIYKK
jgi:hypothetical protein